MKRLICFLAFALAFVGNALAQWNQDSKIRETHWFGQYEYLDQLSYLDEKNINWSGNYIQSIEIVKSNTGQYPYQRPKTSFYSWLDHQLRFSVDDTSSWTIDASNNSAYSAAFGGQGLKNSTWQNQDFHIHNLQSGDEYTITYYENGGSQATTVTGSATGTATVSIPGQAVIRCVEIQLGEYVASDFKVEEVSGQDVSSLTSSHNSFLSSQGESAQFGDLGYRYSFKGPGVLEDKRGAAPYITMKFGNDNDMTFVRALADVTYSYGSLKQVTPMMFTKNGGQTDGVASTPDGNGVYVVSSTDNSSATDWDTQFWIGTTEYNLPAGQKFKIKFDYKADAAASASTQTHGVMQVLILFGIVSVI